MKAKNITIVLDNIRSRENVGSIFRTADAAGVSKIYLCGITPTPLANYALRITNSRDNSQSVTHNETTDKINKTALGAEKWVPWEYHKQTWRCLKQLRDNGLWLIALEKTKNSKNIFSARGRSAFGGEHKNKKIALVVGNEVKGLSSKILKYCDDVVHIPMYGRKESLNVGVAAEVALYVLTNRG